MKMHTMKNDQIKSLIASCIIFLGALYVVLINVL